jgi:hypothetical protein
MNVMKEALVKKVPVGKKINLFLINNKQVNGTVFSYSDDTFLLLRLTNGEEKPVNYNMIGDWESCEDGISLPVFIQETQNKNSQPELKGDEIQNNIQKNEKDDTKIRTILSMFDVEIKIRQILSSLQVERQECSKAIGNFEEAQRAHELTPRFTGVNRMDGIIKRMKTLIYKNQKCEEFKKILCIMLLETLKIGEFFYVNTITQIIFSAITESSSDDFALCILIGQLVTKTKNYEIVFRLAEKCNKSATSMENLIKLFIYILNSTNIKPSLPKSDNLYSAESYNLLYAQVTYSFPRTVIQETPIEQRSNIAVGEVNGKDASFRPGQNSISEKISGFIDGPVPSRDDMWCILALDGNTYTFLENSVEDADIFKILKDPVLWQNQSLEFEIVPLPNGKKVAKRIELGEVVATRPFIKRKIYGPQNKKPYSNQSTPKIKEIEDTKSYQYKGKDYTKALESYKERLEKAKQTDNTYSVVEFVQQIVQLSIKNGDTNDLNEAEKILFENKNFLQKSSYYTLLIQICEKFGKLGNQEKLLSALDEGIRETASEKTVLYFMLRKAYILQTKANGDFKPVVNTLNQWIIAADSIVKECNFSDSQKIQQQRNTVLLMAAGYISSIRGQTIDYIAPSPLKESIEKNALALEKMNEVYVEKTEDGIILMDQWDILFNDLLNAISPFVKTKLDTYNLTGNIRINLIDDQGKFIGTVSEAIHEYKRTIDNKKVSTLEPVKRYEEYLKAARILYDALTNKDNPIIDEDERKNATRLFSFSLGKSLVSFGDYAVKDLDYPLDTARYYYYEGLKYLIDEKDSQDRHNTATRMVLSFFIERSEIPLPSYGQDTSKNLSYNQLPQLVSDVEIKQNQINEFANFVFQYLSEDIFKNNWFWFFNPVLKSKIDISKKLNDLFKNRQVYTGGAINEKDLRELLESVKKYYLAERKKFLSILGGLNDFSFSPNWLSTIDKLIKKLDAFRPYMLQCDISYLERIKLWLSRASEYNDNTDSETKRVLLKFIIDGVDKMIQDINKEPSKLAFENFLEILPRFQEQALSAFSTLCETNPPNITIELSGEKEVRIDNGKVFIQINVKNKHNCLIADSLSLSIEDSEKFMVVDHDSSSVYIRGGESKLFQFSLQIKNNTDKVLKLRIKAAYTRTKSIDENIQEEKIEEIAVALTNEKFKAIDNPYEKYANGIIVEDEKMFFGRREFIDGIVSHLIDREGKLLKKECILLYGQKRTGKSSILMHLKENIAKKSKNSIIVDLKDISVHDYKNIYLAFARWVCKNIKETLENDHVELYQALEEEKIAIPDISFSLSAEVARLKLNEFFHDLTKFLERKSTEQHQDYNIVIMIDEFTAIYSWIQQKRLNDDFMPFWKGFINNNKLVGILAGKDTMSDFIEADPNAFGAINKNLVTYLPEAESERMIKDPPVRNKLMFEGDSGEKAVKRIRELTADSAWFNMILLDRLVKYMNDKQRKWVSDADINTLCKERIFGGINPLKIDKFEPLYDDGDKGDNLRLRHNLVILYSIATSGYNGSCNQGKISIDPDFNESIDDIRKDEIITRLISRDVLVRDTNDNLKIKVGLFYDWLTQYCSPKTIKDFIKNQLGE